MLFALTICSILFIVLMISIFLGRLYGRWQLAKNHQTKIETVSVAEGMVFALLGLLVAFTFTGAYERFEKRELHILDEASAIRTAYQRIDLLNPANQIKLKEVMQTYLDHHIEVYKTLHNLSAYVTEVSIETRIENQIWNEAVLACNATNNLAATMLLIPAINKMFDVLDTGVALSRVHTPIIIFILIVVLAILGSLLAGYSMTGNKGWSLIHVLSYAAITAFTIYLIVDLEFPRFGMIRVDPFDKILVELRKDLN